MDEENLKTPPNNPEAERAVLGSILMDTTERGDERVMDLCLSGKVVPETFFDPRNREIYTAMVSMNRHSKPLDALSLIEELRVAGKLEAVGGVAYIQSLIDQAPTTAHAEHHIGIIAAKHLRRMMIDRATKIVSDCYDEKDHPNPMAVLGDAERSLLEIGAEDTDTMPWASAVGNSFEKLNEMFKSNGSTFEGLATGLTHLDEKLQGLKKSEMIVIAARPSVGKTSLAMNIAESCALGLDMNNVPVKSDGGKRHPVMIFSLEMPIEALTKRMVAGRAQIDTWRLNRNLCTKAEKQQLTQNLFQAVDDLRDAPIYVDDAAALDVMELRARARRAKKAHGIELIVIDYLQLCTCREAAKQASRQIEVSMISQQIKAMAKELKVPVIVLSQLSRDNEKRGDKYEKPKLSDLRDSGAIEQDADVVFLLRRPSRNEKDPEAGDETLAIIDVAKNRNGETGEVRVNFFRKFTRFGDREIPRSQDDHFESSERPPEGPEYFQDPLG
jgi:replicative DNA helicase